MSHRTPHPDRNQDHVSQGHLILICTQNRDGPRRRRGIPGNLQPVGSLGAPAGTFTGRGVQPQRHTSRDLVCGHRDAESVVGPHECPGGRVAVAGRNVALTQGHERARCCTTIGILADDSPQHSRVAIGQCFVQQARRVFVKLREHRAPVLCDQRLDSRFSEITRETTGWLSFRLRQFTQGAIQQDLLQQRCCRGCASNRWAMSANRKRYSMCILGAVAKSAA